MRVLPTPLQNFWRKTSGSFWAYPSPPPLRKNLPNYLANGILPASNKIRFGFVVSEIAPEFCTIPLLRIACTLPLPTWSCQPTKPSSPQMQFLSLYGNHQAQRSLGSLTNLNSNHVIIIGVIGTVKIGFFTLPALPFATGSSSYVPLLARI